MKFRESLFGILLLTVVAVTAWRILTPREVRSDLVTFADERPAPPFQLIDQNGRPSQLEGYLHRHRIVLVFFDASHGINGDPLMRRIRDFAPAIKRAGVRLIAVSLPLRPEFKPEAENFPFPVLHDTRSGQLDSSSVLWGTAVLPAKGAVADIRPAVFVIEHTGLVEFEGDKPKPIRDPELLLTQLISGS
jgi:peroxiredoxin